MEIWEKKSLVRRAGDRSLRRGELGRRLGPSLSLPRLPFGVAALRTVSVLNRLCEPLDLLVSHAPSAHRIRLRPAFPKPFSYTYLLAAAMYLSGTCITYGFWEI